LSTSQTQRQEPMQRQNLPPQQQNLSNSYMNNNPQQQEFRGKGEIKLDQVPVLLKPSNIPSDKENFEAELISKRKYVFFAYFERIFVGFLF
jgi:hypothetical protein